jgi:hypothetical protein
VTPSLLEPPLFSRLERHDRILIAGAGGGFDVYSGLALFRSDRGERALHQSPDGGLLRFRPSGSGQDTETIFEVSARIRAFRHTVEARARRAIPH